MAIKVLIVDDSILVQRLLKDIIDSESDMEVLGIASDPYEAREIITKKKPDIITLDIDMPKMNGLTFLKNLKKHYPIPTLIISSLIRKGNDMEMRALELGAYDVVEKPSIVNKKAFDRSKNEIVEKIRAGMYIKNIREFQFEENPNQKNNKVKKDKKNSEKIVLIGASTGGPEAVYRVVKELPENYYGVVVVMHMPEGFTNSYATRLNITCKMKVKEAEDGDEIINGRILIAPGNKHIYIKKNEDKAGYYVNVRKDEAYNHYRPSVDLTYYSAAKCGAEDIVAVIMTGMGKDGANGIAALKERGGYTIAQNEESCVVFGMPKAAIEKKAIDKIINPEEIAEELIKLSKV